MSHIVTWRVSGMHCASCERLIEQTLRSVPGVLNVEVSLQKNRAGVELDDTAPDTNLDPALKEFTTHGYTFHPESLNKEAKKQGSPPSPSAALGLRGTAQSDACALPSASQSKLPFSKRLFRAVKALVIVGLAVWLIYTPISKLIPNVSASASFGALLLLGLVASVSSCLAMTGGFILAYSSASKKKSSLAIHSGRLFGFAVGGAVLGSIGKAIPTIVPSVTGMITLVLGIAFLIVALNLLDLSPSLSSLGIRLPKSISKTADRIAGSGKGSTPFLIGALTFFLPCGFTQTAQALALVSGSPLLGAAMMTAFALGTLPVLSGVSHFGSLATFKKPAFRLAIGSILFFFAFSHINGGLTLLGSPLTPETALASVTGSGKPETGSGSIRPAGEESVNMSVTPSGYAPSELTIHAGSTVHWIINGDNATGCSSSITIPSLGVFQSLHKGDNVITFKAPTNPGALPFSCGMGMVRGTFTVI